MTDEQLQIAEALRDLHLPPPISAWPPAPGWWLLFFLLLSMLVYAIWRTVKFKRNNNPRRRALLALTAAFSRWQSDGNQTLYLQRSHHALRRLAIGLAGRTRVSRLSGEQWVDWLDSQSNQPFSEVARFTLAHGAYQKTAVTSIDQLHTSYVHWARHCRPQAGHDDSAYQHKVTALSMDHAKASTASEQPYA